MDVIIRRRSIVLILFLVFLIFSTQNYFILISLGMNNIIIICKPSERTALLSFKQDLKDPSNSLSSWSGENCCSWSGVHCSNRTHHVIRLQLHHLGLGGELNPSLKELKQLKQLDLSWNYFEGIRIPGFVGSLQNLRYLNLSNAGFGGMIPHQLGNLLNLSYLDLSDPWHYPYENAGNFQWISNLFSLKHLDLSGVNRRENASSNWFHYVNMLPSLLVLRLRDCSLSGDALPTTTSLSYVNNFTSLAVLDLSWNNLNSTLPEWLYSLTNLQQLDLSWNSFQGTISASIGNLTKLTLLDLSSNQLEGEIPITLGNLCKLHKLDLWRNKLKGEISGFLGRLKNLNVLSLRENQISGPIPWSIGRLSLLERLDLRDNKFSGSLPESLGNLSKLGTLDITKNAFEGVVVSEVHFANLTNLQYLSMDSLVLKISPEWVPPFQLVTADLRSCRLGPGFPLWLRTQMNLTSLYLFKTGISGTIPTWFWTFTINHFTTVDLSHNELYGELPKVINATTISLKSNQFSGQLPRVTPDVYELDLSNNSISGPIFSTFLCNPISAENNNLRILDLSDNLLSGDLSDCWVYWASLNFLSLGGNKITGKIPNSMGSSLLSLQQLHLGNNRLSGELPSSLRNCASLRSIDFGQNGFTGRLPTWLGESFPDLKFLRLRSNKFYGEIPLQLCHLSSVRVLDIAHNDLQGSIPRCFKNFSAIAAKQTPSDRSFGATSFGEYLVATTLVTKGREFEYRSTTLQFVTSLDLSKNSLSGEIPEELTNLIELISFNLSDNRFTGEIPDKIGNMRLLESLDFSKNRISGVIPQSISELNFLSNLNLSYNNLSGKIPLSTQLQRLTEFSFIGNEDLCGLPFKNCSGEDPSQNPSGDREVEDEDWFEMKWFYMSMGVGFVFGFWVFCGVIVLKGSWRIAYFRFLDDMKDKLCLLF